MTLKRGLVTASLAVALLFGGGTTAFGAELTESYANSLKGVAYEDVLGALGEPDYEDEISGIRSATWTDENYNTLLVTTGVDGITVEVVVFSSAGDLDQSRTVDADLETAYHDIEWGMTYDEVVNVIGAEGTEGASSAASFGSGFVSASSVYSWRTADFESLSIAFSDDAVNAKSLLTESGDFLIDAAGLDDLDLSGADFEEAEPAEEQLESIEEAETSDNSLVDEGTSVEEEGAATPEGKGDLQIDGELDVSKEVDESAAEENSGSTDETVESTRPAVEQERSTEEQGGRMPDTYGGFSAGILGGLALVGLGFLGLRKK